MEDNFTTISEYWSLHLDYYVSPSDVGVMMTLLKLARIKSNPSNPDSWIDSCGYMACGGGAGGRQARTRTEAASRKVPRRQDMRSSNHHRWGVQPVWTERRRFPIPPQRNAPSHSSTATSGCSREVGRVWEPACGSGAISKVLEERRLAVISTDLHDQGYGGDRAKLPERRL